MHTKPLHPPILKVISKMGVMQPLFSLRVNCTLVEVVI